MEDKSKILRLRHELYEKGEITEKELYDTYFNLFIKKDYERKI